MDSVNLSSWSNRSCELQNVSQCSFEPSDNHSKTHLVIPSLAIFFVCALGLPGNVFVFLVYIRQMTSSIKVYMFALAIADMAVCVCGIVLTSVRIDFVAVQVVISTIDMAIGFSMYLLVFVSIERLLAVRHPHTFNLKAERAKAALAGITLASVVGASVMALARLQRRRLLAKVFPMCVIFSSVLIITVCYTLLAVTLLKKANDSRNRTIVTGGLCDSIPRTKRSMTISMWSKTSTKQAKNYKGVLLLFIITVVFIACWTPQWLYYAGVPASAALRRVFMLNSAVNPFIYSVVSAMFREDVRRFYGWLRATTSSNLG